MARTTIQKMMEVVRFKEKKGNIGVEKLAALYEQNLKQAADGEKLNRSYIDAAMTVHDRVFSIPKVREELFALDNSHGHNHVFDSIYKMDALVKKAKTQKNIQWVFLGIVDTFRSGILEKSAMTMANITGKNSGGKGLADLFIAKVAIREHFLNEVLDKHNFPGVVPG